MKQIMNEQSAEIVSISILRRYKNNIEKLKSETTVYKDRNSEVAYVLDLLRCFYFINYRNLHTDEENILKYKNYIFDKIRAIYREYYKNFSLTIDKSFYDFKDFTATLLLKMEHRTYIYFII